MNRECRRYCLAWGIPPTFFHPRYVTRYDRIWWAVMKIVHPRKTTPKTSMRDPYPERLL